LTIAYGAKMTLCNDVHLANALFGMSILYLKSASSRDVHSAKASCPRLSAYLMSTKDLRLLKPLKAVSSTEKSLPKTTSSTSSLLAFNSASLY